MLLQMKDVKITVQSSSGARDLLNLSELSVAEGEAVGVVGETGSGKTMTSLAITRLFPTPAIRLTGGSISFAGQELSGLPAKDVERLRGKQIGMIFQDPSTSLNPVFRIGRTLSDLIREHHKVGRRTARERAVELLRRVELPQPEEMLERYPFELSGGQRQRVMIAMALVGKPKLLIADEPTTALDVTIQAGVLSLLKRLQREEAMSMMMITHNMGLVAHTTDRLYVMYDGEVVETGETKRVLTSPGHPYTRMLLRSIPSWEKRGTKLSALPVADGREAEPGGEPVPASDGRPNGCVFAGRCPYAEAVCRKVKPELRPMPDGSHLAGCHRLEEIGA